MKRVLSSRQALDAFTDEVRLFVHFIRRAVKRVPLAEIKMSQFDNPYWEPLINWRGRLLGMERLLIACGVSVEDLTKVKSDAGVPEDLRNFRPHGDF